MAITKVEDLIIPEVMADAVAERVDKALKFKQFAKVDTTLEGEAGETLVRPKYAYIGPAEDLVEGVAVEPKKISMTSTRVTIKEVGVGLEPTEKALLARPDMELGLVEIALADSISDKMEVDYLAALNNAVLTTSGPVDANSVLAAIDKFEDEEDFNYILFINPKDHGKLRKELVVGNISGSGYLTDEGMAEVLGVAAIVKSKRVEEGSAFVQKEGAVEIVYKKQPEITYGKNVFKRTVEILGNALYVIHLYNDTGVVKISGEAEVPEVPEG